MTQISRRSFLRAGSVLGCSLAAHPLVTTMTLAATPGDARLVVLILRGGMDGLDVLRPVGDPEFRLRRPQLSQAPGLELDGYYELHPELEKLLPLWRAGELGFAQAVSTPYRDKRSHFDGQDILEAGTGPDIVGDAARGGWLNRMLGEMEGVSTETAFAIGRETPLILSGAVEVRNWSPSSRLDLSPQSRLLLERMYHGDAPFQTAVAEALELAQDLDMGGDIETPDDMMAGMREARKLEGPGHLARFAADRLREDTRIATYSLGGWDTHVNQSGSIVGALRRLQQSILVLKGRLGPVWSRTTVLAMTEFGRTAAENGSKGTDHGTGGLLIMAGGAVRGGRVYGDWPGLSEAALYDRRDLMPTDDVRRYAGWALRSAYGLETSALEGRVFPGLTMGGDPKLLL